MGCKGTCETGSGTCCDSCRDETCERLQAELADLDKDLSLVDDALSAHEENRRMAKALIAWVPCGMLDTKALDTMPSDEDAEPLRARREDLRRQRTELLARLCESCPTCSICREAGLGSSCPKCHAL